MCTVFCRNVECTQMGHWDCPLGSVNRWDYFLVSKVAHHEALTPRYFVFLLSVYATGMVLRNWGIFTCSDPHVALLLGKSVQTFRRKVLCHY